MMKKASILKIALFALCSLLTMATFAQKNWDYTKETPLADVRVRQALAYAIDMKTITETIFEGLASPALSMTNVGPWQSDKLVKYDYNPEKAKQLLAAANWPADYTLDVVTYYADQQTADFLTAVQSYLEMVGVTMKWRLIEGDLAAQLWVPPADREKGPSVVKWDLAYAAVAASAESEFYVRYGSTAPNNSHTPKDATMDKLLEGLNVTDVTAQMKALKAVQERLNQQEYSIPLYHQIAFIYVGNLLDTKGITHGNDQFSYEKKILDWNVNRSDKTLYTNMGPKEFFEAPITNPGLYPYQEQLFDKLISADSSLTPTTGMLAKTYTVSPDGMKYDFDLRTDVKWHDGKAFSADDVKFSIEFYARTNSFSAVTFKRIKGAQDFVDKKAADISGIVVKGSKVTITFDKIAPDASLVFSQWPMLPKHLLSDCDPLTPQTHAFWQKPIGTGPFKVSEFVRSNYAVLERNAAYYKKGTGNIQKIYMSSSGDNDPNLVINAEAGKIDYAWSKSTADAKAIGKLANFKITKAPIRYTRFFHINQFPHEPNIK
ncbi:MAG: ABC transporter substrate-binding protein [Rectinemataceae bacterium]